MRKITLSPKIPLGKKMFFIVVSVLAIALACFALASCKSSDPKTHKRGGLNFEEIKYNDEIIGYGVSQNDSTKKLKHLEIPSEFKGKPVLKIELRGFVGCEKLEDIVIPNSVLYIDNGAFINCTGLKSINIPKSIISIGYSVFADCSGLESITVEESNPAYHSSGDCLIDTRTKELIAGCKNSVIPTDGSVTKIGINAFNGHYGLTSIAIPNGVTSIGGSAFSGCLYLTSITIPKSVTTIEASAFYDCSSLTNIDIPNGVTSIDTDTFFGCSSLKSVTIPNGVKRIACGAFSGCTSLTEITIPKSVTGIWFYPMTNYYGLNKPAAKSTPLPPYDEWVFNGCVSLESIIVESGNPVFHSDGNCLIDTENKALILGCKNSVIPTDGSVTSIETNAFNGCVDLINITIPNSVTIIKSKAFAGCANLKSLTIENYLSRIDFSAFADCGSLSDIYINCTRKQWEEIRRFDRRDIFTDDCTVHCIDD